VLVGKGLRLTDLSLIQMLNFAYSHLVADADEEGRKKVNLALAGRLGEHGGEIIDDPMLPASMQGKEAPSWWNSDHDAFADQHTLADSDTQFHGVR